MHRKFISVQNFVSAFCVALISLLIVLSAGGTTQVHAQVNNDFILNVDINTYLADGIDKVDLLLELENTSPNQVLTRFSIPDIWGLAQINSANNSLQKNIQIDADQQGINFNFVDSPLLPQQKIVMGLSFAADVETLTQGVHYLKTVTWATFASTSNITVRNNNFIYPSEWPEIRHNLKPGYYSFSDLGNTKKLALLGMKEFEAIWAANSTTTVEFRIAPEKVTPEGHLELLSRESFTQKIKYDDLEKAAQVFRDESGNVFASVNSTSILKGDSKGPSLRVQLTNDFNTVKSQVASDEAIKYLEFPLPENVAKFVVTEKNRLGDISLESFRPKGSAYRADFIESELHQIIEFLRQNYDIDVKVKDHSISETGIVNPSKLNMMEYLLVVNNVLKQLGVENNIVYLQRGMIGADDVFVLEVCESEFPCLYFNLNTSTYDYLSRRTNAVGRQLAAFSGINQLVFAILANNPDKNVTQVTRSEANVAGLDSQKDLRISLNFPEKISNFQNFSTEVVIDNTSDQVIFLESIKIENNIFPIVDNSYAGFHEGVMPGQSKIFKVNNVFIPRVMLDLEKRTTVGIDINYFANGKFVSKNTEHSISLQQNLNFVGLILIALISLLLSVLIMYNIYRQRNWLFFAAYWQGKRRINELIWSIKQRNGLFKK